MSIYNQHFVSFLFRSFLRVRVRVGAIPFEATESICQLCLRFHAITWPDSARLGLVWPSPRALLCSLDYYDMDQFTYYLCHYFQLYHSLAHSLTGCLIMAK